MIFEFGFKLSWEDHRGRDCGTRYKMREYNMISGVGVGAAVPVFDSVSVLVGCNPSKYY